MKRNIIAQFIQKKAHVKRLHSFFFRTAVILIIWIRGRQWKRLLTWIWLKVLAFHISIVIKSIVY